MEMKSRDEEEAQEVQARKQESFLEKWKKGIEMITPLQSLQAQQKGNWVMLFGLFCGIVVMAFKIKQYWWIEIILCAAIFNQSITMIGIWQKIKMIRKLEEEA